MTTAARHRLSRPCRGLPTHGVGPPPHALVRTPGGRRTPSGTAAAPTPGLGPRLTHRPPGHRADSARCRCPCRRRHRRRVPDQADRVTTPLGPRPEASAARPLRPDGALSRTGSDWIPSRGHRAGPPGGSEGACAGGAPAAGLPHARWGSRAPRRALTLPAPRETKGAWNSAARTAKSPRRPRTGRLCHVGGSGRPEPGRAGGARLQFRSSGGRPGASSRRLPQPQHLALPLPPGPGQGRRALAAGSAAAAGGAREGPMVSIRRLGCPNLLSTLTSFSPRATLTPVFLQPASPGKKHSTRWLILESKVTLWKSFLKCKHP